MHATTTLSQSDIWFVAYTCEKFGNEWKCGCRDSACRSLPKDDPTRTGDLWPLQGITK